MIYAIFSGIFLWGIISHLINEKPMIISDEEAKRLLREEKLKYNTK